MKRCKRCNKPLADQAKVCPVCGADCNDNTAEVLNAMPDLGRPVQQPTPVSGSAGRTEPSPAPQPSPQTDGMRGQTPTMPRNKKRKRKKQFRLLLIVLVLAVVITIVTLLLSHSCGKTSIQSTPASSGLLDSGDAASPYTSQFADTASANVEVPNVVGLPLAEAQQTLSQAGLVVDAAAAGFDPAYGDSVVLSQSRVAGEFALTGDHVALTYNALPMTFNVFAFSPREGRITLGNLLQICKMFDTTNPSFSFRIIIHAVEEYELKGGFRCLTGAGEDTPISRLNTQLLREGKAIQGLKAQNAYDDSIGWTISLDDWTGFHFDNVTGYDVIISSQQDASLSLSRSYLPADTKSMTLLDCGFNGGRIRLDVASEKQLIMRITDEQLLTGYKNSPDAKGSLFPVWDIKLPISSYLWIGVNIDGRDSASIDQMKITGVRQRNKGEKASSFDSVSYSVDGDTLVISLTVPDDMDFSLYKIEWLTLDTNNGASTFKARIR